MFIHDSEHSYENQLFEFRAAVETAIVFDTSTSQRRGAARNVEVLEASHPEPDASSVAAARRAVQFFEAFGAGDAPAFLSHLADDVEWGADASGNGAPWYGMALKHSASP